MKRASDPNISCRELWGAQRLSPCLFSTRSGELMTSNRLNCLPTMRCVRRPNRAVAPSKPSFRHRGAEATSVLRCLRGIAPRRLGGAAKRRSRRPISPQAGASRPPTAQIAAVSARRFCPAQRRSRSSKSQPPQENWDRSRSVPYGPADAVRSRTGGVQSSQEW